MAFIRCETAKATNQLPDSFTLKLPVSASGDYFDDNKTVCKLNAQSVSGTIGDYHYTASYPGTYAQNGNRVVSTYSTYQITFTKN